MRKQKEELGGLLLDEVTRAHILYKDELFQFDNILTLEEGKSFGELALEYEVNRAASIIC